MPKHGATSTLLTLNNSTNILINCGLSSDNDISIYEPYQDILQNISLIIVTSASLSHSGALPFLAPKKTLTTTPIYYLYP
jgi:Cft2 family RNA processing exonuclease